MEISKESPQVSLAEIPSQAQTAQMALVPVSDTKTVVSKLLPETEIQEIYLLATMSRNIITAQCHYFLDIYQKLCKLTSHPDFAAVPKEISKGEILLVENDNSPPRDCKVGIIGCGRIGRSLLISLLKTSIFLFVGKIYRKNTT